MTAAAACLITLAQYTSSAPVFLVLLGPGATKESSALAKREPEGPSLPERVRGPLLSRAVGDALRANPALAVCESISAHGAHGAAALRHM